MHPKSSFTYLYLFCYRNLIIVQTATAMVSIMTPGQYEVHLAHHISYNNAEEIYMCMENMIYLHIFI